MSIVDRRTAIHSIIEASPSEQQHRHQACNSSSGQYHDVPAVGTLKTVVL